MSGRSGVRLGSVCALLLVGAVASEAQALRVLTVGKVAVFRGRGDVASAMVRVGKDPALATLADPTCGGGAEMTLQVAGYPSATWRLAAQPEVALPCAAWTPTRAGYVYRDRAGGAGGVRKVVYSRARVVVKIEGGTYEHVAGPLGYAELWIGIGGERLLARFQDFRRNRTDLVVSRKPSRAAAEGEAAFWDVLHGVDGSDARQEVALQRLTRAAKRSKKDGRSRFLLAMMHLYRFGQSVTRFDQASAFARAEIRASHEAFGSAVPLLWDGVAGDSRVAGFAAAVKYGLGTVDGDAGLQAEGLADLDTAIAVNEFFNVFDLIPVAQAVVATDPLYAEVLGRLDHYLNDPGTLACLVTQPEICADQGLAPRNATGALLLFGDLYAKGAHLDPGNVARAETWYAIAQAASGTVPGYRFAAAVDARVGHAQDRADLYQDADASNDPPVIGAGPEACAVCHYK